ncbi:MAG: hypothetical protein IJ228_12590 [Succinivibrio sp.]|nr:hypothetical protein [Succinivibrio sp.]
MLDPTNFSLDAVTDPVDRLIVEGLTTTEEPVSKIAEKLGFRCPSKIYRTAQKYLGYDFFQNRRQFIHGLEAVRIKAKANDCAMSATTIQPEPAPADNDGDLVKIVPPSSVTNKLPGFANAKLEALIKANACDMASALGVTYDLSRETNSTSYWYLRLCLETSLSYAAIGAAVSGSSGGKAPRQALVLRLGAEVASRRTQLWRIKACGFELTANSLAEPVHTPTVALPVTQSAPGTVKLRFNGCEFEWQSSGSPEQALATLYLKLTGGH